MVKKMKNRAVIYARFSSAKQTEQSIEGQLEACLNFAAKKGFTVTHEYIDRAASGMTDRREEFQNMILDAKSKLFDYIIVYQYDRFARSRRDSINYKYILKMHNITLLSATEPEITDRPTDLFLEGMLEISSEYYSRDLAQKTTRGMKTNLQKRKSIGGQRLLGYATDKNKEIIIHKEEAEAVVFAFNEIATGKTVAQVIDELNNKYKYRLNRTFTKSITTTLRSRKYIGEYTNPFTNEIINDMYPPIIDKATFELVQKRLDGNKKYYAVKKRRQRDTTIYHLSGKLFCGQCGAQMVGISGNSRKGKKYRYYTCKNKFCEKTNESKTLIEQYVINSLKEYLSDPLLVEIMVTELIAAYKEASKNFNAKALKEKIKLLEKEINNIVSKVIESTSTAITRKLNDIARDKESEIQYLKHQLESNYAQRLKKLSNRNTIKNWIGHFHSNLEQNEKTIGMVISVFINAIYVFNDKIAIYFNLENTEPIKYDEVMADLEQNEENKKAAVISFNGRNGAPLEKLYEKNNIFSLTGGANKMVFGLLRYR